MRIHVWVPDYVSATGGIQTLSQFVVRALRDSFPESEIKVLSKNDQSFPAKGAAFGFSTVGWWSRRQRTVAFTAELLRQSVRERPSLILTTHANFSPVAHMAQRLFKIPFIALGNGIEVWEIQSPRVRESLRAADRLLAISGLTRERMAAALNIALDGITLFPCTFEPTQFVPRAKPRFLLKRYGLRPEQPTILTVARLASGERYKGYDQVLRALPAIRERWPDVRYVIGGRGPDRARVVALIKKLGLEENVILAGYVPDHELCSHYNLCDVFVMPSKGEGFGIVFLEALACGKPVIAGNKDGSVDAVLNGKLGVLVDPDDVGEIAEAICAVLSRKVESRKEKVEKTNTNIAHIDGLNSDVATPISHLQIPEVIFNPEELRRRVIDAYGYERFVERVREIVGPFVGKVEGGK